MLEIIVAMAVSGMLLSVLLSSIFQTTQTTAQDSTQITALSDIDNAARWLAGDVRMAFTTNLVSEYPAVYDTLVMDWTDWANLDPVQGDLDPVDRHLEYTLSGTALSRTYDEDVADLLNIPLEVRVGRYISNIEFSRQGRIITVVITSSPEGKPETAESLTYLFSLSALYNPVTQEPAQ